MRLGGFVEEGGKCTIQTRCLGGLEGEGGSQLAGSWSFEVRAGEDNGDGMGVYNMPDQGRLVDIYPMIGDGEVVAEARRSDRWLKLTMDQSTSVAV